MNPDIEGILKKITDYLVKKLQQHNKSDKLLRLKVVEYFKVIAQTTARNLLHLEIFLECLELITIYPNYNILHNQIVKLFRYSKPHISADDAKKIIARAQTTSLKGGDSNRIFILDILVIIQG